MVRTICPVCGQDTLAVDPSTLPVIPTEADEPCQNCGEELWDDQDYLYVQPCGVIGINPVLVHTACRQPWQHIAIACRIPASHLRPLATIIFKEV